MFDYSTDPQPVIIVLICHFQIFFLTGMDRNMHKPKLRQYVKIKTDFEPEAYITSFLPKYERSVYAQFRLGILPLRVETGRFSGVPLERRLCIFCNNEAIEDKIHFLCACPFYFELRQPLFRRVAELDEAFWR